EVSVKFFHEGNRARGITSNASITAGEWTHVAVVWDGSEMRLYLDGELDNSVSDDKKIWNNDEPLRIGTNRTEDARFFSGRIEEVRIWDDARSETEIRQHRLRELWGSEEQLSAYFRFNETPGTAVSRAAAERPKTVRLNGNANFAPSRSLYPSTLTATVSRSFDSAANAADYRLVALPGQVDRPLTDAISGEAGIDWQAYHDDGSNSDFLQKYDGSDTFNFEPGTGFWLTSTSDWTHEVDVSTVSLRGDTAAVIGLRDGWNIISNPMGRPVPYDRISTANRAAASGSLQPLWAFDGTFSQADSMHSAVQGVAYYFLNDQGLDSLRVPYPGTSGTKRSTDSDDAKRGLRLVASFAEKEEASASTVGLRLGTGNGPERKNVVAPPSRFESVSLRIVSEEAEGRSARRRLLMRTQRSTDEGGTTVDLQLTSRMDGAVRLSAENVDGLRGREVRLLVPSKGTSHDLNVNEEVVINPSSEEENLQLAVGTKRYVDERTEAVRPDEVSLRTYPNPVRQQGTIEYALPEAETVTLRIYDVLGREVATIVDARKEAGRHTARLATDQLSSGVYFGRLQAGEQRLTRKITVVR
ncbi:MAG TPA: LamG-like jellyroll fold domain-containing protein, partial [Salinibacter sp.]|nr:LamG-like jellyroll fold domain-containing protein [Salinibacter sp.]